MIIMSGGVGGYTPRPLGVQGDSRSQRDAGMSEAKVLPHQSPASGAQGVAVPGRKCGESCQKQSKSAGSDRKTSESCQEQSKNAGPDRKTSESCQKQSKIGGPDRKTSESRQEQSKNAGPDRKTSESCQETAPERPGANPGAPRRGPEFSTATC